MRRLFVVASLAVIWPWLSIASFAQQPTPAAAPSPALESSIFMPLDVMVEGETEKVFERIKKEWGQLDFLLHSIAFSPKEALHGRVVDVDREGFQKTMDVSCWSFMRMAHLAEPLMKNGGTIFTMTYYGSQMVVKNYNAMGVAKAAL